MPRRRTAIKREILPDPIYGSELVSKFINVIMRRGKKSVAEKIIYKALEEVSLKREKSAKKSKESEHHVEKSSVVENLDILEKALHNIRPSVEVKSRRVGGATYQVPVEVDVQRGIALAMRMLADAARTRSEGSIAEKIAAEIDEAFHGHGGAIKKRDEMHRMANANQAFAHYRW